MKTIEKKEGYVEICFLCGDALKVDDIAALTYSTRLKPVGFLTVPGIPVLRRLGVSVLPLYESLSSYKRSWLTEQRLNTNIIPPRSQIWHSYKRGTKLCSKRLSLSTI